MVISGPQGIDELARQQTRARAPSAPPREHDADERTQVRPPRAGESDAYIRIPEACRDRVKTSRVGHRAVVEYTLPRHASLRVDSCGASGSMESLR